MSAPETDERDLLAGAAEFAARDVGVRVGGKREASRGDDGGGGRGGFEEIAAGDVAGFVAERIEAETGGRVGVVHGAYPGSC